MNQTFTDYYKNRYEWAFSAQREFINSFVALHIQETDPYFPKEILNSDRNALSFSHLTELYKVAKQNRKKELEIYEKEIERLEQLIKGQSVQIDLELKEASFQEKQFSSEIRTYKEFLRHVGNLIKEIKVIETEPFVNKLIPFHTSKRKASILNDHALKLQHIVKTRMKKELMEIKEKAKPLPMIDINNLQLPDLDYIPKIQQKIDSFWLNSSYEKSLYTLRGHASDWVVKMFEAYMNLLTTIINKTTEQFHLLLEEKESLKRLKEETIHRLQKALELDIEKRDLLKVQQNNWNALWEQDCEHAKQLPGYFIKHWLLYKEALEQQFLLVPVKERWLVSHYLLLLKLDGERIIDSMKIGEE
jgi:hypothetical protein